ncbi:GNAT family N-acetyltransferase [Haloprofundus halophilus]|uniref:GNAT family N-acetyltransferase n=1 Tax=Haloprofundus halophilus TaxID=2283527 RepID=UPI0018E5081E|nr:GNAT family N-acetyltransferase [Haloprofundus halophilus]
MTLDGMGQTQETYRVRGYAESDRKTFCDLFGEEWFEIDEQWFEWRYSSPYLDEKAIAVATANGKPVGFFPCMVFPLRANGERTLALQPAGVVIDANHRRRGLLTKLATWLFETYEGTETSVLFNFPNEAISPGLQKLGWREILSLTSYFRVQHPNALLRARGRELGALGDVALDALSKVHLSCSRQFRADESGVTVTHHSTVPAEEFESLYAENIPNAIHVARDAAFYRWRYDAPERDYCVYVARRDEPVAGAITCTERTSNGLVLTNVMEAQPMGVDDRDPAFERLLDAIAADHPESDLIRATKATLPRGAALRSGYLPDDELPLSKVRKPSTKMVARPVSTTGRPWRLNGLPLTDPDSWELMLSERDPTY